MGWGLPVEQQIGQEIGRGGFGTVFQALNTATGDFVAVKRMDMDSVKLDAGASIKVCVFFSCVKVCFVHVCRACPEPQASLAILEPRTSSFMFVLSSSGLRS